MTKKDRSEYLIRYAKEKTDAIHIRVQKPVGCAIRQAAKDSGESLQGYIIKAVHARMKAEGKPLLIEMKTEESAKQ